MRHLMSSCSFFHSQASDVRALIPRHQRLRTCRTWLFLARTVDTQSRVHHTGNNRCQSLWSHGNKGSRHNIFR
jgi:hypothetical protein